MLKLGILERQDFLAPPAGILGRAHRALSRTRVSLDLLRMPGNPSAEDIALFERLLPYVRLSNGVYRTTRRARFRNLDPVVNALLSKSFDPALELRVEDWAASDCLTSFEWARSLFPTFPALRFAASDTLLFLVEAEDVKSGEKFVFEPGGALLQYIRPPFVLRTDPPESWIFPLNRWLSQRGIRRSNVVRQASSGIECELNYGLSGSLEKNGYRFRVLSLVHPEAAQLARTNPAFAVRQQSIFGSAPAPCHVVRLMNILNRAYFQDALLDSACRNAISCLLPGGICVIGRTVNENPPEHHVTMFRKRNSGELEIVERIGNGSEIESLALSASRPNS